MPNSRIDVVKRVIKDSLAKGQLVKANKYEHELSIIELTCCLCGRIKHTSECGCEDDYKY